MKILKNESGSMLMLVILSVGTVVALAAAGIINSVVVLNKEAAVLRSKINNQIVIEQLSAMTLQAYNDFRRLNPYPSVTPECIDPADPITVYRAPVPSSNDIPMFCFHDDICVQDPISDTSQLCDTDATPLFELLTVKQGLEARSETKKNNLRSFVINKFNKVVDKLFYLKNEAFALYDIDTIFSDTGTTSASVLSDTCPADSTLCKVCSLDPSPVLTGVGLPNSDVPCIRFRICPNYGGCDYGATSAANAGWVIQKIGVLVNPPSP